MSEDVVSRRTLARAVASGLLTQAQLDAILALEAPQERDRADDEAVRLITSFADIFVTLGILLFIGATVWFTGSPAPAAVAAWLLAEFFTRRRRMALPSIALLLIFALSSFWAMAQLTGALPGGFEAFDDAAVAQHATRFILAALLTIGLCGFYYWRFRVPITVAAAAATGAVACLALAHAVWPDLPVTAYLWLVMALGIAIFALAMRFDMSDPQRRTRRADIAFWLHLLAAPMIVHPLIRGMVMGGALDRSNAVLILVLFLALGLVAVVVDRRALLVSGLAYAGYAFAVLVKETGLSDSAVPLTALALGAFVLVLSAAWQPLRTAVLSLFPPALARHLPQIGGRAA